MKNILEICAVSLKDCIEAERNGADRIELCASMAAGGLTPSFGMFSLVRKHLHIPIAVMIRVRGAGFCYGEEDYEVMKQDARMFLEHGANAIVFGFLTPERHVDVEKTKEFCELAHKYHAEAVFHRAIDQCEDLLKEADVLQKTGVDRILTAGGPGNAAAYMEVLIQLQKRFGEHMQIQICGNIRSDNAAESIEKTGAWNVHSACRIFLQDPSDPKADTLDYTNAYDAVSQEEVKRMAEILHA